MAPVPCLRNTQEACITSLGSEATAQLICNYSTSWWPKPRCCVIWASASQPSVSVAVKNRDDWNTSTSFGTRDTKLYVRNQLSKDLNTCTYISSLGNGKKSSQKTWTEFKISTQHKWELYILTSVLTGVFHSPLIHLYLAYLPGIKSPSNAMVSRNAPRKLWGGTWLILSPRITNHRTSSVWLQQNVLPP